MKKIIFLLFVGVLFVLTACSSSDTCSDCRAAAKSMGIDATPSLHKKLCE